MELHGGIVHRNGLLQHGKIVDRACILQRVIGKGHILCGQRLSVRATASFSMVKSLTELVSFSVL